MRPGRVNKPWPVPVQVDSDGTPKAVGRLAVESVREEWLVEDGWWTQKPLQRRYFELVLSRRLRRRRLPSAGWPLVSAAGLMSFTELHCHSAYSFLDGASDPAELAATAAGLGHEALALTDHDNVCGTMEFAHACKGVGVRPIIGCELTVEVPRRMPRPVHVTLLVENANGWGSLCRLITEAHRGTREGPGMREALPLRSRSTSSSATPRGWSASPAVPATAPLPAAGSAVIRPEPPISRAVCCGPSALSISG